MWFAPVLLLACAKSAPPAAAVDATPAAPVEAAPPADAGRDDVLAVTWVQTAAELDALNRTVWRAARFSLDAALDDPTWTAALEQSGPMEGLTPAIVVDVDETVLDNSPYQARLVNDGGHFARDTWGAWVDEANASPVAGAVDFLSHAAGKGVHVFYVSNRSVDQEEATRKNLAEVGFPYTDDLSHFAFRPAEGDRSKTARRVGIEAEHRIVMLFGDNLFDFVEPDARSRADRDALVEERADWWGERWFMLPNPMYGSWDDVLHGYEHPDEATKHRQRVEALDPRR